MADSTPATSPSTSTQPGQGSWGRTDTLPYIGDKSPGAAGKIVEFVTKRRQGCINALALPLVLAKIGRQVYAWGEETGDETQPADEAKTVVNKAQQAVLTQVANHLKEPPRVTLEPSSTGEYAPYYWCGPPEAFQETAMSFPQLMLDPVYLGAVLPSGQVQPPVALPTAIVRALKQLSQADPDLLDPQFICRLDDEFTAKTLQKQLDGDWRDAGIPEWLRACILDNTIEGWKLPLVEWDSIKNQVILNLNSNEQTYIDQSYFLMRQSVEAGIDLYLDLDEAMAKYPLQRDAMLKNPGWITEAGMQVPMTQGMLPPQHRGQYYRPIIRKVVWWMRNQIPTPEVALKKGLVEQRMVTDGGQIQGGIQGGSESTEIPSGGPRQAGDELLEAGNGGSPQLPGVANDVLGQVPQRIGYFLPGTQIETIPGDPNWPLALRQVSIVGGELVEDDICPLPDIPLLHFRNIPVTGRPWGLGEPFNIKNLQKAYSGILADAIKHAHDNAFPATEMPAELVEARKQAYGRAFLTPNEVIGVPPEFRRPDGKPVVNIIPPPPFPEWSFKIRQTINEDFNQISGRPDVMSGNAPTDNSSGRLVQQLQSAAVEPLNFKAQDIQFALEKLASLMLYCDLHYKPRADIAELTNVPEPLLELVLQRARRRTPHVRATINTGTGSTQEYRKARAIQLNQTVDPATRMPLLDARSAQEANGLDPAMVERRNQMAVRQAATVLAPMQQQSQGGQEEQEGSNHGGNGNGRITE